ncbi:MAG: protein kinase domain-containing protein, partial [Terriglobia bacterium]
EGQTLAEGISVAAVSDRRTEFSSTPDRRSETGATTGAHRAPLQPEETLQIAKQIAEALEFAHERGIIHRDLKPANVKVTHDGAVKVLDFGLAKALSTEDSGTNISNSPTISIAATQAGMILGTAAYMSPEQAKGKTVDRRADIWAFGCVLYEMLTGKKAFEGETTSDVLAAVIRAEPEWNELPQSTPASIRKLLRRCLQKDPKQRLRDIGDARIAIEETMSGEDFVAPVSAPAAGGDRRSPLQRGLPWALAAVFLIAALASIFFLRQTQHPAARMQFGIPVQSEVGNLALSADGKMLTFVARDEASGENMLYVQSVGSQIVTPLPGTEGAYYPFWSPDDALVGFFSNGKLRKVAISGGAPQVIAGVTFGRGASWGRAVIIYAPDAGGPLWRVNPDGTNPAPLTDKMFGIKENSHRWPFFLPDGNHFLFWAGDFSETAENRTSGIYLSSLAAQEKKFLVAARSNPEYTNGHLYYAGDKARLLAVSLDAGRGQISGEPLVIADRVAYQTSVLWAAFAVGGDDTVIYNTSSGATISALTWYDRTGKDLGRVGEPGILSNPSIAPHGDRLAVDIADAKADAVNIWILNPDHNTGSRFTFDAGEDVSGVWSRDETMIAYRSISDVSHLVVKKATGLEPPREVANLLAQDDIVPNSWTPDDRQILCSFQASAGGSQLVLVDVSNGTITPFLATKASETNGMTSPDGKWVAYASNESGEWEIYVSTFPGAQGKWQVSRGGGSEPRWQGDNKNIFYVDAKGMLISVPVSPEGSFSAGAPTPLFPIRGRAPISSTDLFTYDVSKDGKRFLVNRYVKPEHIEPLTVVLNAAAGMKK